MYKILQQGKERSSFMLDLDPYTFLSSTPHVLTWIWRGMSVRRPDIALITAASTTTRLARKSGPVHHLLL